MQRRTLLQALLAATCTPAARAEAPAATERIATAWQLAGAGSDGGFHVGVLELDWRQARITLAHATPVPSRAHGLLALPDGGFVAIANRPGQWLSRWDAQGQVMAQVSEAAPGRSFNGHVQSSADGRWLFTTETHTARQQGWISVRDAQTLARVAEFPSAGVDPHQLLRGLGGELWVAHGGIVRDAAGRKREGEAMAPSLVRLAASTGELLQRQTLSDPWLSIRHMAWSTAAAPLLGLALQAEHADARERAAAPVLAVWDGQRLTLPCADPAASGYVGDIAPGPREGFVLSAQKQGRGLWWHPAAPDRFTPMAELTEPCALVAGPDGAVLLGAGRGLARWQLAGHSAMLRWPVALAPDNHAVRLLG